MSPILQGLGDTHLVRGGGSGVDGHIIDDLFQLLVTQTIQFRAGQHLLVLIAFQKPNLFTHGDGRQLVVARNHEGLDARLPTEFDGFNDLLPRGVDHPGEADKY